MCDNPRIQHRVDSKVAFVTGAASGIGRAIAERLAREGAEVVLTDRDSERVRAVAREFSGWCSHVEALELDVTSEEAVESVVHHVLGQHAKIDILVNCAGILDAEPAHLTSLATWERTIRTNMTSALVCCKAVYPTMAQQRYGEDRLTWVLSLVEASVPLEGFPTRPPKSGLMGLSRHLAREWADVGIRVNSICPGMVDTPMTRSHVDVEQLDRILATIPARRMAQPEEIAALAGLPGIPGIGLHHGGPASTSTVAN